MVWVKAKISDDVNDYVERIQALNGCSKPEAVEKILRDHKRNHTEEKRHE